MSQDRIVVDPVGYARRKGGEDERRTLTRFPERPSIIDEARRGGGSDPSAAGGLPPLRPTGPPGGVPHGLRLI